MQVWKEGWLSSCDLQLCWMGGVLMVRDWNCGVVWDKLGEDVRWENVFAVVVVCIYVDWVEAC